MKMRWRELWKVPVYCAIAGMASFYAIIYWVGRFTIVTDSDGAISTDSTRTLILYGIIFLVTALVGGLVFFRKMTRREIFVSATILVAFQMLITAIQWINQGSIGFSVVLLMYLSQLSEWSSFFSQLIFKMTGSIWIGAFVENLIPYIFVLFGRRAEKTQIEGHGDGT